jgi:hypothetical protein
MQSARRRSGVFFEIIEALLQPMAIKIPLDLPAVNAGQLPGAGLP